MRLSDAEWTVMQAVWDRPAAATARDVHGAVEPATDWSYSTVRTLLARLVDKGALEDGKRGNQSVYRPRISREDARHSALRSLVDRAFGGRFGSLVQHLADQERLTDADRAELERLLDERAVGDEGRGGR